MSAWAITASSQGHTAGSQAWPHGTVLPAGNGTTAGGGRPASNFAAGVLHSGCSARFFPKLKQQLIDAQPAALQQECCTWAALLGCLPKLKRQLIGAHPPEQLRLRLLDGL